MELGLGDDVVIEGPQRGVTEAFVVVGDLFFRQAHADQVHPVRVERLRRVARRAWPAHPGSTGGAHHWFERRHQAAGAGPPLGFAVRSLGPVHRQTAGRNHEVVLAVCSRGLILPVARPVLSLGEAGVGQGGRSSRASSSPGWPRETTLSRAPAAASLPLTVLLYPLTNGGGPARQADCPDSQRDCRPLLERATQAGVSGVPDGLSRAGCSCPPGRVPLWCRAHRARGCGAWP